MSFFTQFMQSLPPWVSNWYHEVHAVATTIEGDCCSCRKWSVRIFQYLMPVPFQLCFLELLPYQHDSYEKTVNEDMPTTPTTCSYQFLKLSGEKNISFWPLGLIWCISSNLIFFWWWWQWHRQGSLFGPNSTNAHTLVFVRIFLSVATHNIEFKVKSPKFFWKIMLLFSIEQYQRSYSERTIKKSPSVPSHLK